MKSKIGIIVEGIGDAVFVRDCIEKWFPEQKARVHLYNLESGKSQDNESQNDKESGVSPWKQNNVIIFIAHSQDKLTLVLKPANVIRQILDVQPDVKILVTFDADKPNLLNDPDNKQKQGFRAKRPLIQERAKSVGVELTDKQIFLFPDNSSDGTLENLLESCIPGKYNALLECWNEYCQCLTQRGYKSPGDKTKIFGYAEILTTYKTAFGDKRDYTNSNHWNLDNNSLHLQPLYNFLKPHFDSTQTQQTP